MSASTVSASQTSTRRRAVDKKHHSIAASDFPDPAAPSPSPSPATDKLSAGDAAATIRTDTRETVQVVKKPLANPNPNSLPPSSAARRGGSARKPCGTKAERPKWLTAVRILGKNLLLMLALAGLVQMVRKLLLNSKYGDGVNVISGDFEDKISEMENFVQRTMKMMQVQVDVVDKKVGTEISKAKNELNVRIEEKGRELESKLKEFDGKNANLEKLVGELAGKSWVSKEEFRNFMEEFKNAKGKGLDEVSLDEVSLDEVRAYARDIVGREIEKHAADGLGRVDYALRSAGAVVLKHSEVYTVGTAKPTWMTSGSKGGVSADSDKMLKPSFGEPGHCFPLKGSSGFVHIRLRSAIVPEAVTLEHVAKSVAYDRSSAPKDCRVFGWLQGQDTAADNDKMLLLAEFTYDLDKSNVQTFNVMDSAASTVVDTVKFEFASNHGATTHTCIYRLRVHGHEPDSVLTTQS